MNNNFTPAPWIVSHIAGASRPIILTSDNSMLAVYKFEYGRWRAYRNEEADARLFSASPDGYALAQLVSQTFSSGGRDAVERDLLAKARAIIAKVETE